MRFVVSSQFLLPRGPLKPAQIVIWPCPYFRTGPGGSCASHIVRTHGLIYVYIGITSLVITGGPWSADSLHSTDASGLNVITLHDTYAPTSVHHGPRTVPGGETITPLFPKNARFIQRSVQRSQFLL